MLSEHISGDALRGAARRSSTVMLWPPPVVMLMTASQACLMRGRNCMNTAGSGVGLPSLGSRAWRWRIAAPASAAPIACAAISSGVTGKCGLMVGVWIEPVTAQVIMTLPRFAIAPPYRPPGRRSGRSPVSPDEVPHLRVNLVAPAPPVEDPVMADIGLDVAFLLAGFKAAEELMRRGGLADRANVVVLALDGQERGAGNGAGFDRTVAQGHFALRQRVFLKDATDGLQVEIGGQIHHRHVFVVETLGRPGALAVAPHQMLEQLDMGDGESAG